MSGFSSFLLMYLGVLAFCLVMGKYTPIALMVVSVVFFCLGQYEEWKRNKNHFSDTWKEVKSCIPKRKTPFQKIVYASIDEFFLQLEYADVLILESAGLKKSLTNYFDRLTDDGWQKLREEGSAEQIVPTMVSRIIKRQLLSGGLHVYRGMLSEEGQYYLEAFKYIGDYRVSKGFISADDFARELADVKEQMSEVG